MGRWRALALAGLAVILSLMTWFSATAILPELTHLRELSLSQAAWLTNAVQIGFAVGAVGSSLLALSDVLPLRWLMAGSTILSGLANLVLLAPVDTSILILARFATGVALAGVYPPAIKLIATWFVTGRGLALGAMVGALSLGSALPHLVRATGNEADWQATVIACSVGSFAAALLFGWALRPGPHSFRRGRVDLRWVGAILGNRPVMLANLGYFGHMWELYAIWGWFLAYASAAQGAGLPLDNASALTFAVIAMGAPGCVAGGWLADRIGRCRTTMLMLSLSGLSALVMGFVFDGPAWLFWSVSLIWGFTVVADSAQFSAAVTELSEPDRVGSSLALQMGVGFAITTAAIWVTPLVAEALGSWRWAFLILVPGPFIGFLAMAALHRDPRAEAMAGGRR